MSLRNRNDNQSGHFVNQRMVTVAGARETIGNQVVQQTGIQCFNCKGFGHLAKECRKPKRVKDYAYHKEKMMLCKQEEKGVLLSADQGDWLDDTDEEPNEQELEAYYMYMAKIQEVLTEESGPTFDAEPLEKEQSDDDYNVFANERHVGICLIDLWNLDKNIEGQSMQRPITFERGGNSQVKDNKIDLLVQQYEQFVISEDESINSAFARFNTIITSLKALDEGYSSKNYVRKFLRDLHPKWRKGKNLVMKSVPPSRSETESMPMVRVRDIKKIPQREKEDSRDIPERQKDVPKKPRRQKHEFDNEVQFGEFCNANGITHNFSAPRTPQSNGVVERKNMTLQEMSRTMLNEQSLPQKFWCNAVDTSTYILNRILIRAILGKTPYELLKGRKPTLDYFRVFGSKCFILNTKDYLAKFYPQSYEGVFLGYSQNSKAYIILTKHTRKIKESLNVTFDETPSPSNTSPLVDDDLDEEEAIKVTEKKNLENDIEDETLEIDEIVNIKESRNHPLENVIGNLNQRTLRSQAQNQSNFFCFISTIEPKNVNEALAGESSIVAMQEELNQFIANEFGVLVP
ncbi:retrovirus-related pol polyprotein from transposon TNT 1-94 [Tanacetum coccineum]